MHHPRNKAERRRINKKKSFKYDKDREEHVQARLAQEQQEAKEALDVLRQKVHERTEESDD